MEAELAGVVRGPGLAARRAEARADNNQRGAGCGGFVCEAQARGSGRGHDRDGTSWTSCSRPPRTFADQ